MNRSIRFVGRVGTYVLLALVWYACAERPVPTAPRFAATAGSDTVVVDSTSPDNGPRGATLDVQVLGSGFSRGSRADFALHGVVGANVVTNSTRYVKSTELVANITIAAEAVVDEYDVIVTTSSGRKGVGIESFAVTPTYQDLGTLGGSYTVANALNTAVQVVGFSRTGKCAGRTCAPLHAFLWESGTMRDLGTLPGSTESSAWSINDLGAVVGHSQTTQGSRAWFWTPVCGMVALPVPPGATGTTAYSVNNAGLVAGGATDAVGSMLVVWTVSFASCQAAAPEIVARAVAEAPLGAHKMVSETGRVASLNAYFDRDSAGQWQRFEFGPWPGSYATDISGDGRTIVGSSAVGAVWTDSTSTGGPWLLEPLPSIGTGPANEQMVNATGTVVTSSSKEKASDSSPERAVMWTRSATGWRVLRLGEPKGSSASRGRGVVTLGYGAIRIAGFAGTASVTRALLWTVQ